jgi:hypothetical protein
MENILHDLYYYLNQCLPLGYTAMLSRELGTLIPSLKQLQEMTRWKVPHQKNLEENQFWQGPEAGRWTLVNFQNQWRQI